MRLAFFRRPVIAACLLSLALPVLLGGCSYLGMAPKQKQIVTQQTAPVKPAPKTKTVTTPVAPTTSTTPPNYLAPPTLPAPQMPTMAAPVLMDGKTHVAILLPLSGKNANLGQAMVNAAQMAVFDLAGDNFELMPRDTGNTPESAALAAQDAMASGAQLLIGPLFAADVAAVKPVVQTSSVNMLALSSDVSLASPGAYVIGFSPSSLVNRIVAYAAHRNLYRMAALLPNSAYGKLVHASFKNAVAQQTGTLVAAETYTNAADIDKAVKAVLAKADQIDALFIPSGGNELIQIAASLTANGFDKSRIRLLGSGLWDEALLGKTPVLVGGWFAAAEPEARETFMKHYAETYGQTPPRLTTLAYDATALAVVLSKRGSSFDRVSLGNPSGFAGLDGIFRLTPQGTAERGLAIHEVGATSNRVIDPSPSTFVGIGD